MSKWAKNKSGWATVGGKKHYFKSDLELHYAVYLELLKRSGYIEDWWYEPKKFKFFGSGIPTHLKGKTQGSTVYTPDFKTIEKDGEGHKATWHECKGYLDAKDYAKLRAFKVYYPIENLIFVVRNMPKGNTANSLKKRQSILRVKDKLGYMIRDIGPDIRRHGQLFGSLVQAGK